MASFYAAIAFAVLWLLLAAFFYVVLRAALRLERHAGDFPWEHGL